MPNPDMYPHNEEGAQEWTNAILVQSVKFFSRLMDEGFDNAGLQKEINDWYWGENGVEEWKTDRYIPEPTIIATIIG